MNFLKHLSILFFIFFYLYNPNIKTLPFSIDKILFAVLLIWSLLFRRNMLITLIQNRSILLIFTFYIFLGFYTFVLDSLVIDGFGITYHLFQYSFQYIPFTIFLYLYITSIQSENPYALTEKLFIAVVLIQSSIGLLMLFNPII